MPFCRPTHPCASRRPFYGGAVALAALVLALGGAPTLAASPKASPAAVAEHRADLKDLRGRITQIRKEMAGDEASRAEAADQLQASERAISRLQQELRQLSEERASLLSTRDRLRSEAGHLEGRLDGQQAALASALAAHHRRSLRTSGEAPPALRLEQRALALTAGAHARQIALTAEDLGRKARHAEATDRQANALARVEAAQRERQAALMAQRATRQQLLRKISARLETQRQQVETLKQDERRLSRLVDRLSRALAARQKPRSAKTAEPAPPGGRQSEKLASGPARLPFDLTAPVNAGQGKRAAKGIFFPVPEGHDVRAVAGGQVVFADWLRGFGNLLIIDHGNDFLSIYGYNDALLRQVGDRVGRGEVVASAGDSGGRGETGLYFEMRHEGAAIDAMRWLARR